MADVRLNSRFGFEPGRDSAAEARRERGGCGKIAASADGVDVARVVAAFGIEQGAGHEF